MPTEFPHLQLNQRLIGGRYKHRILIDDEVNPTTENNLNNRPQHAQRLRNSISSLQRYWNENLITRQAQGLPPLPEPDILPLYLRIDVDKFNPESLKGFGIELISEEDDGYIIGASAIQFSKLNSKIEKFLAEDQKNTAQLWEINTGLAWRVEQILSPELQAKWGNLEDDELITVDVGIACYVKKSNPPSRRSDEIDEEYDIRFNRWKETQERKEIERDAIALQREEAFERLVNQYNGTLLSSYIDYGDCFSCRIEISVLGLKDILFNYPYLFEISEEEKTENTVYSVEEEGIITTETLSPEVGASKVCVIDSGIQEDHILLQNAILPAYSKSYIPGDLSVADGVNNGGHGTKVAGAILYPNSIPKNGQYQLPFFILNARVLNERNNIPPRVYPAKLMKDIFDDFDDVRIFNMSIASRVACRTTHMSQWAASIDSLIWNNDILFLLAAGNLYDGIGQPNNPGIRGYLQNGIPYVDYLLEDNVRIANPGQSCFALTVGSVCIDKLDEIDKESFGEKDEPSSFSRTGLGLWGMIKPDVVEYGGDWIKEKNANPNLSISKPTSVELVQCTLNNHPAIGYDIGTSFATPKVAHIAAILQNTFPDLSALMYRALIAQSARWPANMFANPNINLLRHLGYGIPSLERATQNSSRRITFIAERTIDSRSADIFVLKIPDSLRNPGEEYNILIEVTLSFKADIRRTRKTTRSYLSSWLSWENSKLNENFDDFNRRIITQLETQQINNEEPDAVEPLRWTIRERNNWGPLRGVRRQDSSLQKDWTIIQSYNLPEEFCLAVVGHKGWEKDFTKEIPYALTVSFEILNSEINIYERFEIENRIQPEVEIPVQ